MESPDPDFYFKMIKKLLDKAGFKTYRYKDSFLKRRINAGCRRSSVKSLKKYHELLKKNPEQIKKLEQYFSINMTRFYRNQDTFEQIEQHYLSMLVKKKKLSNNVSIKLWSVGCATGAEPYTYAIILNNLLKKSIIKSNIRIIGTDNNQQLLSIAKEGIYPAASMDEVPLTILKTNFTKNSDELYQINPQIKKMVQFQFHDLLKDPPLKQQDIISCRNVLIYFSRQAQFNLYNELIHSLKPNGLLIIGRTEILPSQFRTHLKILDSKHRIYQKIKDIDPI